MNIRRNAFLLILFLDTCLFGNVRAQSFDFTSYPTLDFSIDHMDLDLVVDPAKKSVRGTVGYQVTSNIGGAGMLVLHAAHMQITAVSVDGGEAEFTLGNDSLFVALKGQVPAGEDYNVSITYEAVPRFGLLKNNEGTVWTSLLPRAVRHWLPVIDHPRVSFSSNLSFTVPSGYSAVATGLQMNRDVLDSGSVVYVFRTEQEVPASALAFAVGKFEREQTSFGLKRIMLFAKDEVISQEKQQELLEEAYDILLQAQQQTGYEFPFEGLNIVVLPDHFWETKSWGASTIFLYRNRGDLEAQLRRGIYGQWFGVYQREEQWSDAGAVSLYQTVLHYKLNDEPALLRSVDEPGKSGDTIYAAFGVSGWNRWQQGFPAWQDSSWKGTISRSMNDVLEKRGGVYTWNDYARIWYRQTGQPHFKTSGIRLPSVEDTSRTDSVLYRVDYSLNESEGLLSLSFTAQKGRYDELVSLPLIQVTSGEADTSSVTFTGAQDSVIINVPALVQSVHIEASSRPELSLDQYKPVSFLIYELRNASTVERRRRAAEKLGAHADNPDLQFAIEGFMKRENSAPEVKAALLTSLAKITNGAAGTEQIFLDALKSDQAVVRQAGLMALQHYPANAAVREAVVSFALEADSLSAYKNAVRIFSSVADTAVFNNFIPQIVRADTAGYKAIFAIQEWANSGQVEQAVQQAEFYIMDVYDYPVRAASLRLLTQHDHAPANWKTRAEQLLNDSDPRIRFLAVRALSKVNGLDPAQVMAAYIQDEYDARVYRAMQNVMKKREE